MGVIEQAFGRCSLDLSNGAGLCTFSDGTGQFAGFQARINVTYLGGPNYGWKNVQFQLGALARLKTARASRWSIFRGSAGLRPWTRRARALQACVANPPSSLPG